MRRMVTTWLSTGIAAVCTRRHRRRRSKPTTFKRLNRAGSDRGAGRDARRQSPVQGLKADQFEVFVDGRRQPIVSLDFIRMSGTGQPTAAPPQCTGSCRPRRPHDRVAIDQESFPVSGQASAREAAMRVVNTVAPEDSLGLIAFPAVAVAPTRDHAVVRAAIAKISGLRTDLMPPRSSTSRRWKPPGSRRTIPTRKRSPIVSASWIRGISELPSIEVIQDGGRIADALERQAQLSISGLRGVLDTVGSLPGPQDADADQRRPADVIRAAHRTPTPRPLTSRSAPPPSTSTCMSST